MAKNYSGVAPSLWTGFRFRDEYGEPLTPILQSLWIASFGRNIFTRQKKEIFQLSLSMPASPIKLMLGFYPHIFPWPENSFSLIIFQLLLLRKDNALAG